LRRLWRLRSAIPGQRSGQCEQQGGLWHGHPASAPALTLTGGLRYTSEHKDYTFVRQSLDGGVLNDAFGVGKLNGVKAIYNGQRVDWRVSADYRFSPAVMAYATVSTGFKGGGVVARPFTALQAINGAFGPETLTAYEAGLKTNLFDRKMRLNISSFYNDYKNIQLPIADCSVLDQVPVGTDTNTCAAVQNAGDGHMYGLEAELSATPIRGSTSTVRSAGSAVPGIASAMWWAAASRSVIRSPRPTGGAASASSIALNWVPTARSRRASICPMSTNRTSAA
jgi:outer membrane receptor protein involved in Fe transport